MILKMKGRTNRFEQYVKDITFRMNDGSLISLNRNRTEYVIDHGCFDMVWRGIFTYSNNKYRQGDHDFTLQAKWFKDAKIEDVVFTDEAPRGYEFIIESWTVSESG